MSSPTLPKSSRKGRNGAIIDPEERKSLLSGSDEGPSDADNFNWKETDTEPDSERGWSRNRIICSAVCLIALLITGAFARTVFFGPAPPTHPTLLFHGDNVRSNGTHDFKRTVLIVSIDGLRNHWALMTGLYAESNGMVGNNFWDPVSQSEFYYNRIDSAWNPAWWFGEPMWETAGKAGIITANLMWPGPPKTTSGASSTYFVPWEDKVPLQEKLDQLLHWIDSPFEERPQLLMMYEPSLDQAGHKAGPASALVNKTLAQVDVFAKDLHIALQARNLTDIIDVVFVSDHGMTDTSHPEHIYIDDILGDGYDAIEHEDGWPAMGLRFAPTANVSHNLDLLRNAAAASKGTFDVYTHETMPQRYHFAHNERIAPIYVVPKIGYILTTHAEGDVGMSKGNHGYDNAEPAMHAMFVAHGPFPAVVKVLHQDLARRRLSRPNKGWHSTADDTYVMDAFPNVQIYSLVMRLLGVDNPAPTNGSAAFWDKYF
ncbi:alkaline-phosphatase-like protein [Mycena olivaceomarginata]|nr:alkaline-phosphatase-like protein [Mycena olivaceomarginata]